MRPHSITMFDKLFLGSLALGVVNSLLSYGQMRDVIAADPMLAGSGTGFIIGSIVFSLGLSLLLWYFISRRASNVAKWILVVFTVLGLLFLPSSLGMFGTLSTVLTLAVTALQIAALVFLFRPDAKAFFAGRAETR